MRNLSPLIFLALLPLEGAFAAFIHHGRYNPLTQSLDLSVDYTGGCTQHTFKLKLIDCKKYEEPASNKSQVICEAKLLHDPHGDMCQDVVGQNLSFPAKNYDLDEGALIRIKAGQETNAVIMLPKSQTYLL